MRDLIIRNSSGSLVASMRCEMIDINPSNFEPVELRDDQGRIADSVIIGEKPFVKVNYEWVAFIEHCRSFGLGITHSETNGENPIEVIPPAPVFFIPASNLTDTDVTIRVGNRPEVILPANVNDFYNVEIAQGENVVITYANGMAGLVSRIISRWNHVNVAFSSGDTLDVSDVQDGENWVFGYQVTE